MLKEILEDTEIGMEKSLGALDVAFKKIRTGRATPSLLDSIKVNYYDKLTPLAQVASISIEDAKTLAIAPWEKGIVQEIEKAISESELGLNPATSGETIRVILPDLTEETRRDFIKKAKAEAENAKISVRNVRRDGNSQLKEFLKEKEISEDEKLDLLFLPSLSTKDNVTDVSGRGVGMDAVRVGLSDLGGKISVKSKIKHGTTFTITLPNK